MRVDVLGIPFDCLTPAQAVERAAALTDAAKAARVVTPNPEIVWKCKNDVAAMRAVSSADLILADGIGIVNAAKTLGRPLPGRVPGFDWACALLPELASRGKRLYLLGGKPGVAQTAADNLKAKFPDLTICGVADGYFSDKAAAIETIRKTSPDVVFVCLGAPRQELFMEEAAPLLGNVLMAGLGGSVDVWAGAVTRAPAVFCKLGIEWLYRALRQPSRIPRLFVLPRFMRAVKAQKRRESNG